MSIFFISDTHFSHNNIIKYSNRPFSSVQEMDEQLVKTWNQTIKPNDLVYHLGDFAFSSYSQTIETAKRLNGKINLILGNHDKELAKEQNKQDLLNSKVFNSIQNYLEIKNDGQSIILFHFSLRVWNKSHHGSWHLYGHSHGNLPPLGNSVDVGIDAKWITEEYRPIAYEEIKQFISTRM